MRLRIAHPDRSRASLCAVAFHSALVVASLANPAAASIDPSYPGVDDHAEVVAFVHVHVVPMDSARILDDHTVLVEGDRIARVAPSSEVSVPDGARTIDGRGELYLIPGLCDSHVHVGEVDEFTLYVANGVTTVRNMGGEPVHWRWKREIEEGRVLGPTLFTTSPALDGDGPAAPGRRMVRTRAEAELAIGEIRAAGYELVEVRAGLGREAYEAIAHEARRTGLRVVGEIPRSVGLEGALAAGQVSIEHADGFLDGFFRGAGPDLIPDVVKLIAIADKWVTPTLVRYETIGQRRVDSHALSKMAELQYADPAVVAKWTASSDPSAKGVAPVEAPGLRDRLLFQKRLVLALDLAGVRLLAGTDAGMQAGTPFVMPGFSLTTELWNLVDSGLSPYRALATATIHPARFLEQGGEFGVVAEGARADLVLLEKNPLEDIGNVSRRAGVMLRGKWMAREELDARLERLAALYRTEAQFVRTLRADGVALAAETWRQARGRDPHARLFREGTLDAIARELLDASRTEEAIAAFRLNVAAYPDSADASVRLGDAYARAGDDERAVDSYSRALALDPAHARAKAMLARRAGR